MENLKFLKIVNLVLGTMCGLLIAFPIALSMQNKTFGTLFLVMCTVLGTFSGYRRAKSRAFMYFCIVAVCVLSTVISFSGNN